MPLYEFKCAECGRFQMTAHPTIAPFCYCTKHEGKLMHRVFTFGTTNMPTGAGTKMHRKAKS